MPSLKQHAGYLEIDHSNSPGLTAADLAHLPSAVAVPGGAVFEADVLTCTHCQRGIVMNPSRQRERAYCNKCNHYICDSCENIRVKSGECVPMAKILDKTHEHAEKFVGREDNPEAAIEPLIHLTDN